ncbi:ATP-binding protein [Sulfitobacter sp. 1A13353]|uniref:ATP-binding protein n=1 Tax=Sulfitobacter sp. 1A13353 TaxID=3368568 RepID=UPI003746B8C3
MPQISVPKEFFRSERDTVYADWRSAFWREFISNSVDAGAKSIKIRTRYADNGDLRVDFADDGCGMDRDLIENVYMRLGSSTKAGTDSVGGFGRARLLTCFSHERYKIRSCNIVVEGEGADYTIRETQTHVRGTAVSVDLEAKHSYGLMRGLRNVLKQSSIRLPIVMDLIGSDPSGAPLNPFQDDEIQARDSGAFRFTGWSRKGKHFADLADDKGPWAHLHVSRGATAVKSRAVVRVDGIAMYDEHISAPVQVTVDLVPDRSREVLTASRDSIRGEFRTELMKFFSQAAADHETVFREKSKTPETHLLGVAGIGAGFAIPKRKSRETPTDVAETLPGNQLDRTARMQRREVAPSTSAQAREQRPEERLRLPVALYIDNPSSAQRATIARYRPDTWSEPGGTGRNAELLHAAWTGACRYMLEKLSELDPTFGAYGEEKWVTGFIFDENLRGLHKAFDGVRHGILMSPVDRDGRQAYKLSDPASLKRLGILAAHEVVHCVNDWHDERYATLFTNLVAETSDRDMLKAMGDEMSLTRDWQKARSEPQQQKTDPEQTGPVEMQLP